MKWMGLNELRESYLSFFESKGHLRMNSFPLVPPADDNSILLINAGMTPLKKYFQGIEEPPRHRMTTCQKCIRTPDIENVGKTARHGTYFEMLGNFSFGDYFKHEAIAWAWEYLTKVLEIPAERLWVTIYEQDDEAGEIWANEIGVPRDRIIKLGKADNFWEHGSGPCGPCSEIHFDRGEKYGPLESFEQAEDCDRIIEIWNNVFTQFDNDGKGNYTQLATKNIDTGMGLERLACVMQDVDNLFEVDTVRNIMGKICDIIGVKYHEDDKKDVSIRVITDHIRSTTFMVGDGILPSNEGRGYVLRRLLRRAARHGRLLGYHKPFLYEVCDTVIDENISAYPELGEKRAYIKKVIQTEEESFAKTIDKGTEILNDMMDELKKSGEKTLKGEDVFKLHDTYGFPIDLTKEILLENGFEADEAGFAECMKIQKQTARDNKKLGGGWDNAKNSDLDAFKTEFVGYDELSSEATILAIVKDGESVGECFDGDEVGVIVDKTPFYAEMGGQVGDKGEINSVISAAKLIVNDTQKLGGGQFICYCTAAQGGHFRVGDKVFCYVDEINRMAIQRNHTCCHLLQAALREVLGEHVHQSGSYVDEKVCRFDFSHFRAMTPEEIASVEYEVNNVIMEAVPVVTEVLPIEEARKKGAMALFGEKYGDTVRVVSIGDYSTEFCGGTHLENSGCAGLFKIVSESSVASGVRRIEAYTGMNVLGLLNSVQGSLNSAAAALKLPNANDIVTRCESVMGELREKDKKIQSLEQAAANAQLSDLGEREINGVTVIAAELANTGVDGLRKIGDSLADKYECFIAVLAGSSDGKGNILCKCSKSAVAKGANAGTIVREVAVAAGGKGGGKPDQAMAGVPDASKLKAAIDAAYGIVEKTLAG